MNANSRDATGSRRDGSPITRVDDDTASFVGVPALDDDETPIAHCHWLLDAVTAKEFGHHLRVSDDRGDDPVVNAGYSPQDALRWTRQQSTVRVPAAHDPAAMPPHPRAERTHSRARAADRRGP